jgi:hypothetical protein
VVTTEVSTGRSVLGTYRLPREIRYGCSIVAMGNAAFILARSAGGHRLAEHLVGSITFAVVALVFVTVPMTRISADGIHRWWSTQKAHVPWERVREIEVRPVDRRNKYPVHVVLANDDTIVLPGVPAAAADGLRELTRQATPSPGPA